jgi:soluble lytic murein transglycosylase-like protein
MFPINSGLSVNAVDIDTVMNKDRYDDDHLSILADWIPIEDTSIPVSHTKLFEESLFERIEMAKALAEEEPDPEPTAYFDLPLDHDLQDHIFELCEEYNIEPRIVFAVIWQESRCTADIKGDRGRSLGLMQIQPKWHSGRMEKLGCDNLLDPYQNVMVGIDYLADLYKMSKSTEWVLMAYNGGPSFAREMAAKGEVSGYAKSVMRVAKNLGVVYA